MAFSTNRMNIERSVAFLNAFGGCQNKCKDLDNPCDLCKVPFKYHLRALQQPFASIVVMPPSIYEYIFDTRKEKKPVIRVPYFMIVMGYSSAIDTIRFQLSPDNDSRVYTDHVRTVRDKMFPRYLERLKQFQTEADAAYLIEEADSGRLALVQAMERMIVFGLACFAEINQRPGEEDMFNKMLARGEKNVTTRLAASRQPMLSNENFNEAWKAYKIGQMYKQQKEAGMDVDD